MRESNVLNKLRSGECALSTQIGSAYAPFVGIAAQSGFDCVWLDLEHKSNSQEQIRECILAAHLYQCDTVVRIRKRGYLDYSRALEDGATGIMVPHCMGVQDAVTAVTYSKYEPVGMRGMDFTGLGGDYMMTPQDLVVAHAQKHTFTMLQIEDVEALSCLEEISCTPGVDILFVGPADLKQSAVAHGIYADGFLPEVYRRMQQVTKDRRDLWWGTVVGSPQAAKEMYDYGCRFINLRGDFGAVASSFASWRKEAGGLLKCAPVT